MQVREQSMKIWLQSHCPAATTPELLAGDASFRRYFRLRSEHKNYILMDAPPEKESCQAFVAIASAFQSLGLRVPDIFQADLEQGFLLLDDFGDQLLLQALNEQTADHYYQRAFDCLLLIQSCKDVPGYTLPTFDEALYRQELDLFQEWYLQRHLGRVLTASDQVVLDQISTQLIDAALAQPQVCVHRDFHSRNLMVLEDDSLGILDFQDAVRGPITYDLMSLLRDCYIEWPFERVKSWLFLYQQRLLELGHLSGDNPAQFLRWCDWIALQRHLKCIGIFARLHHRDNKSVYLESIPRVIAYAKMICQRYPEFSGLLKFLVEK